MTASAADLAETDIADVAPVSEDMSTTADLRSVSDLPMIDDAGSCRTIGVTCSAHSQCCNQYCLHPYGDPSGPFVCCIQATKGCTKDSDCCSYSGFVSRCNAAKACELQ